MRAGAAHGRLFSAGRCSQRPRWRFGDETHLGDAGALGRQQHAADRRVGAAGVAAHMHFGLGLLQGDPLQALEQRGLVGDGRVKPVEPAVAGHGDDHVLGLALAHLVALFGQLHRHREVHHRDGDQEDDQQHQHHVDQGRRVDGRDGLVGALGKLDGHGAVLRPGPGSGRPAVRGLRRPRQQRQQRRLGPSRCPAAPSAARRRSRAPRPAPAHCGAAARCSPARPARRRTGRWRS
mmetsp:Transcript_6345/g.25788  ORF Transcript_6345/g.25788 Transcript_6345/m.25788 type:complete len:235 (-) Transcript_6345:18-722(-)